MANRANFKSMSTSTADDWKIIIGEQMKFIQKLPDRVLTHLRLLDGDYGGFPIDRLQHSLQTATLAQHGGENEEYIICALLHDIGDTLGSLNHPDVAAAILKPFVSEANHWMIQHHGIFQGYHFFEHIGLNPDMREQFRESPYFERTARFCEIYDNPAFDTDMKTLSLDEFEPMLRRVFAEPKNTIYRTALE